MRRGRDCDLQAGRIKGMSILSRYGARDFRLDSVAIHGD